MIRTPGTWLLSSLIVHVAARYMFTLVQTDQTRFPPKIVSRPLSIVRPETP